MMSLPLYMCRINTFFWPYVLFSFFLCLLGTWKSHKMLVKCAIRLPNQFLTHNIVCHGRNQLKMAYFIKLVILIFSLDIYMNLDILKGFFGCSPVSLSTVLVTPDKARFISLGQWRQGHGKPGF